jgi:hypothetical protein
MNPEKLPNFFIIGAAKAGTTSLHGMLGQHPQIFTTKIKASKFFINDKYFLGIEWYQENYFRDASGYPARGESTPGYLTMGHMVSQRMKETFGDKDIKFIAIFRDPVLRAYSHYWFSARREKEDAVSFEEALACEFRGERKPLNSYYWMGCYATLLQPFFEKFPRDRFHFLLMDDIINDLQPTMKRITHFLEVQDDFVFNPVVDNRSSVYKNKQLARFLRDETVPLHKVGKIAAKFLPRKTMRVLGAALFKSNLRPQKYPPLDEQVAADLRRRYKDEIIKLETIIDRDLSQWYGQ